MKKREETAITAPMDDNLVTSWRRIMRAHGAKNLAEALSIMNQDLGTHYFHHRITAWEQGKRQPSQQVINYMLSKILPVILSEYGLTIDQSNQVIQQIKIADSKV